MNINYLHTETRLLFLYIVRLSFLCGGINNKIMAHLKVEINEEGNVDLDMTGKPYDLIDALATCMEQNEVIAAIVVGAKEIWERGVNEA